MTAFGALALVAALQAAFIVLTLTLLLVTRARGSRERDLTSGASEALAKPLERIMLGGDRGEALALALSQLPPRVAGRALLAISGTRLSPEQRADLAALVRHSPWVERALAHAHSPKWWKRIEAARLLAMVCEESDGAVLARLVTDRHAAVASAATAAIRNCAGYSLVRAIVGDLPSRPPSVRLQQCNALRSHGAEATAAVVGEMARPASPGQLRAWIELAEVLATPAALAAVLPFAVHPDVEVRTSTARALRRCFSADGAAAVTGLLGDADWRVRAAAARAVGALKVRTAIPLLSDAMHDESWWVRFRAGLALADLSQEGRWALTLAQRSPDPFARDMATLIRRLSEGSRLDLTSA